MTKLTKLFDLYETEVSMAQGRMDILHALIKEMRNEVGTTAEKTAKRGRPAKENKAAKKTVAAEAATAPVAAPKKRGRKPKAASAASATATTATAKKRGRKSKTASAAASTAAPVAATEVKKTATATKKKTTKAKRKSARKARPTHYKSIKGHGGPKMKWGDTIIEVMRGSINPMSSKDIADRTIAKMGIGTADADRAKLAVSTNLTKLLKEKAVIKHDVPGQRAALYSVAPSHAQVVAPAYKVD